MVHVLTKLLLVSITTLQKLNKKTRLDLFFFSISK